MITYKLQAVRSSLKAALRVCQAVNPSIPASLQEAQAALYRFSKQPKAWTNDETLVQKLMPVFTLDQAQSLLRRQRKQNAYMVMALAAKVFQVLDSEEFADSHLCKLSPEDLNIVQAAASKLEHLQKALQEFVAEQEIQVSKQSY